MSEYTNWLEYRCVNIDWLECYCLESGKSFPHDAEYFERCGYSVIRRDYGTRQYEEVFTVCDVRGDPFCEVRRKPVSGSLASRVKGIFSPFSCHIRLVNRYCYADNAVDLFSEFLNRHGYAVQRLFRFDLCCDFEKFDDGTDPKKFLKRYLSGQFTKVNQGSIAAHGRDRWEGRDWNSVSWGAKKSMVTTKMYLKSLELRQVKDKPYIRYAWQRAGLVDDYDRMLKRAKDGTVYSPDIWRIEFSITSSAKGWFIAEDCSGKSTKTLNIEHTLDTYDTKEKQIYAFENLAKHYFHFKHYENGKRKDLCKDRVLFHWADKQVYTLDKLLTERPKDKSVYALRERLERYRETHFDDSIRKACNILIRQLSSETILHSVPSYDRSEADLLQLLIARRMRYPLESYSESIETLRAIMDVNDKIF